MPRMLRPKRNRNMGWHIVASKVGLAFCAAYPTVPEHFLKPDAPCELVLNYAFVEFDFSYMILAPADYPVPDDEEWIPVGQAKGLTAFWCRLKIKVTS